MHYIKVNQHAAAIHISRGVDEETGRIDYPLCGIGSENMLGRKTVPFRPVIVTDAPTCKRCLKFAAIGQRYPAPVAAPEPVPGSATVNAIAETIAAPEWITPAAIAVLQTGAMAPEYLRALRNFRDFGYMAAQFTNAEIAEQLINAKHLHNGPTGRLTITNAGLEKLA